MTSAAIGVSVRPIQCMSGLNSSPFYGITGGSDQRLDANHRLVISSENKRKFVLKLLEDLETNVNEDKNIEELIAKVCRYLKSEGIQLDADSQMRQQMDVYFNLLRNVLRNPKLNPISRTMVLEVIELRATNWLASDDIEAYYRKKLEELHKDYELGNDFIRGLKTSQSSGALLCPTLSDVLKSSGKFTKPTKVVGKTFLRDEVVIRNGDSGKVMGIKGRRVAVIEDMSDTVISFQKVSPGAKERLVQISGPTEDNIERAKELIETTIKRNASPVPFECPNNTYDLNLNRIENENQVFDSNISDKSRRIGAESEDKMKYSFTVEVDKEVIQLSTNNKSLGLKAKQLLQKLLNPLNNLDKQLDSLSDSYSDDNFIEQKENVCKSDPKISHVIKDMESHGLRPQSATRMETMNIENPIFNKMKKSSSQGTVPITPLVYPFYKSHEMPKSELIESKGKITYDRQFLMSCAELPVSRMKPKHEIMSNIYTKTPDIIRNSGAQNSTFPVNESRSYTPNPNIENW